MRIRAYNNDVYVRPQRPNRSVLPKGVIYEGSEVEVVRKVTGESIDGNNIWYETENTDYMWSGGFVEVTTRFDSRNVEIYKNKWLLKVLELSNAWRLTRAKNVKIAILDTGINYKHKEFENVIEGYYNFKDKNDNVMDLDGHGTHCAGIVGSRGADKMIGIAPECQLFIAKVMTHSADGIRSDVMVNALDWAIQKRVDIISLSNGGPDDDTKIYEKIREAVEKKITVVAAIGNTAIGNNEEISNTVGDFPARYPQCISVGALTTNLKLTKYTHKFSELTITAPGDDIYSTWIDTASADNPPPKNENEYIERSGTSQATPIVAGVVALIKSRTGSLGPSQIMEILKKTARSETQDNYSYRVINPLKAITYNN